MRHTQGPDGVRAAQASEGRPRIAATHAPSSCPRRSLDVPHPFGARVPYPWRFRRLLSGVARASQPSCLRLPRRSNASRRFGSSRSALHRHAPAATTASADFCPPIAPPRDGASQRRTNRSPGVRRVTFAPTTRRIYARWVQVTPGFGFLCPLAHPRDASSALRLPRAGASLTASFPRRLATTQLLFG